MTIKTKKLLDEMTDALFEKKAVLLTGNTGVGKTYLAKKISEKLVERKYSCFPSSKDQTVNVEIISCHNSVTYEEIVGGITADTDSGKMFFEYKDKIFLETIIRAAVDYNEGKGTKYVLIMDDLQRNDVSTLIGDAVNAIGLEGEEEKLCLNSGMIVEIPPNFYIIGTYNAAETGAILLPSDLISKFYVREILSEIEYITEDLETENAVYYDQVRSLVLNYLDMQYRRSTYDQSRYFLGHGYFSGNNVSLKIRYQLIPILKQYISEGILDSAAEESVHLLETACIKKKVVVGKNVQKSIYSEYRCGVTAAQFIHEDSTRKCSSIPIENLVGRIIDQQLLSDEKIKHAILFNKKVCYREMEVGGVTYQAIDYIKSEDVDRLYVTYSESRVNLGIHYYRNKLYTSNLVGICRIKSVDNETLYDAEGNELLIKVIPRFNVKIVELLNYMRDDDEFDRYMAPQTISNRHKERDIEAIDRNEIFYFFGNENPLKVDDKISGENSIITVTVFLTLLRLLCKKPLMGRMLKEEKNLTGKVKGKIVIEKNIRANTMHGRNDRFYCQYLQFSEDIIENQILKAALKKSKRFVIEYFKGWGKDNNNYTSMISYCSNALRNISDIQCDGEACNGLKFSGCYIYYKPVMAMAKMVLDDISIECFVRQSRRSCSSSSLVVDFEKPRTKNM